MNHLTLDHIHAIVDRTLDPETEAKLLAHAGSCPQCGREIEFQRSLLRGIRSAPVVKTSPRFTANVMDRIVPSVRHSFILKLFGNGANLFAMVLVLSIIGTVLSYSPPPDLQSPEGAGSGSTALTQLLETVDGYYQNLRTIMTRESGRANESLAQQTSGKGIWIVVMTIVTILLLAGIDRYLIRGFVRMRL